MKVLVFITIVVAVVLSLVGCNQQQVATIDTNGPKLTIDGEEIVGVKCLGSTQDLYYKMRDFPRYNWYNTESLKLSISIEEYGDGWNSDIHGLYTLYANLQVKPVSINAKSMVYDVGVWEDSWIENYAGNAVRYFAFYVVVPNSDTIYIVDCVGNSDLK